MPRLVGIFAHSLKSLFGKIAAVKSGHANHDAFHHLPFRAIVYVLCGIFIMHAVLLQLGFVEVVIVFISGIPVNFMKDYDFEKTGLRIANKLLKSGPVVVGAGKRFITVLLYDCVSLAFAIFACRP